MQNNLGDNDALIASMQKDLNGKDADILMLHEGLDDNSARYDSFALEAEERMCGAEDSMIGWLERNLKGSAFY